MIDCTKEFGCVALAVRINDHDFLLVVLCQDGSEIDGCSRLCYAAFQIANYDCPHGYFLLKLKALAQDGASLARAILHPKDPMCMIDVCNRSRHGLMLRQVGVVHLA